MKISLPNADQRFENARAYGELDMLVSPVDGALVVVPQDDNGQHFCHQCGEGFDPMSPKKRGVEVQAGGTRLLLHPGCVDGMPLEKRFWQAISFHQFRRKLTHALKGSASIADAAAEGKNKIVA